MDLVNTKTTRKYLWSLCEDEVQLKKVEQKMETFVKTDVSKKHY